LFLFNESTYFVKISSNSIILNLLKKTKLQVSSILNLNSTATGPIRPVQNSTFYRSPRTI
jgi:hypothetical protein